MKSRIIIPLIISLLLSVTFVTPFAYSFPAQQPHPTAIIFSDDFDGEAEGTSPPANWIEDGVWVLTNGEVDDAQSRSASHSMLIVSDGTLGVMRTEIVAGTTAPFEFYYYLDSNEPSCQFFMDDVTGNIQNNGFDAHVRVGVLGTDNDIKYFTGAAWVDSGYDSADGAWKQMIFTPDYSAKTYDVEYDGVLVLDDVGFQTGGATDTTCKSVHLGLSASKTMWVDDVLIETPPVIYTSAQNGSWNQLATWGGTGPPGAGDTAFIEHDVTITTNQSIGTCQINASGDLIMTTHYLNLSSDFDSSAGTFTYGTSTIRFTETADFTYASGQDFYNVLIDESKTVTGVGLNLDIYGTLTANGVLAKDTTLSVYIKGAITKPVVVGDSGDISDTSAVYFLSTANPTTIEDTTYNYLATATAVTYNLEGAITANLQLRIYGGSTLDTTASNHGITTPALLLDQASAGTLKCRDSAIDVGANGVTVGANGIIDADTSLIQTDGDWDSSAGTFTQDTSTVQFTSDADFTSDYTNELTAHFYNITIDNDVTVQHQNNIVYDGVLNIGTGSANFSNPSYLISCVSPSAISSPVVLGNANSLNVSRFQYSSTNVDRTNIGGNQTFGCDVWVISTGGTSNIMSGTIDCQTLNISSTAFFTQTALSTSGADFDIICDELKLGGADLLQQGVLTLNGATIDIGSGGFAPGGADFGLDLGTGLLQTDGDIDNTDNGITWATSTIQITDNITYFGTVVAHDLIIDIGKTLIIDDGPGTGLWTGVMTVNGTLDTITNGDIMQTGTGAYPAPLNPIVLGPSGDLTSANISLRGTAGLAINAPAATYYDLSFSFSSAGTTTFGLAGDIVVTNEFWINTITSASRILNFSTNDYNITCNSLFQTGPGTITVSLNDSNVDIGADGLVIATNGVLNGNTSSIELAGDWTNSGTFISGDSTLIINGTVTQNITSGADTFSTVNITNTNSEINFTDDTNITNSTWGSGTTVILSSNMTINSFNATDFVVNSSIPSVTRYLFVPLANRTISNTTFNNVILVPPLFTFPIFNATAVDPTLCYPYTTIFFSCETWVITDIDAVWANISTPGGSFINATMSSAGGDNYTYDQVFIIPGNYSVIFWANDSYYGNANSSAQINFTVLPRPYGGVAPPTWDGPTGPTPFPSDEVEAVDFVMDNSTAFIIIGAICLAGYIMITTQRRRRQDRR